MNPYRNVCLGLAALAVALLATQSVRAQIAVDNFAQPAAVATFTQTTVGSQSFTQSGLNPANTIGGVRDGTVTASVITTAGVDNVEVKVGAGVYDYASTSGADGAATLRYDGAAVGSGDLNLNLMGQAINVQFVLSDSSLPLPVTVTLNDGVNSAAVTLNLTNLINPGDPAVTLAFNPAAFTANNPAINLASINTVEIGFNPSVGRDFRLGGEGIIIRQEIPEPASIALWSLLGLGAVGYARRSWNKGRKANA